MLASITCLKPFLRPFDGGFTVRTTGDCSHSGLNLNGTGTLPKSSKLAAYYELSNQNKSQKGATVTVQSRSAVSEEEDELDLIHKPELVLRPDRYENRAFVGPGSRRQDGEMGIERTQAFTVSYE
jgi:hypothetical protein